MVASDVLNTMEIPELSDILPQISIQKVMTYACKIQWMSKAEVQFDQVKFIRNSHNNN